MKKGIFLFFVYFLFIKAHAQSFDYRTYPSFDSVINSFTHHYLPPEDKSLEYKFARKPDGWYILKYNYLEKRNGPVIEWLYWSGADNSFQKLPLPKGKALDWQPGEYDYNAEAFKIEPYWGYERWSKDVIQVFENKQLNDSLTYSLARAFSNEAEIYIWPHNAARNESAYDSTFDNTNFTKADIDGFITSEKKAINYFNKTKQLNPSFETVVGNIYTKYCNEYLSAYYTLAICGLKQEAQQFLADSLYDPFMISTARNILMSCPSGGTLITNGDNDTYPLVYVQEKTGYRKDVIVCNYNLMNTARYVHYLRNDKNVALTIPDKLYARLDDEFVYIDSLRETELLETAISRISDTLLMHPNSIPYIFSKNIFYSYTSFDNINNKSFLSTISMHYPSKYLYTADIAILDILYSGTIKANICFAGTCSPDIYIPFKNYMQVRGLVYEFTGTAYQNLDNNVDIKGLNIGETQTLLQESFFYNFSTKDKSTRDNLIFNYKYVFIECLQALINEGNNKAAAELVKKYFKLFPPGGLKYGTAEILLARQLQKLNDLDNLNILCHDLINEGNKYLAFLKSGKGASDKKDLIQWLYISNEVKTVYNKNIEKKIAEDATTLYNSLIAWYK